MRASRNGSSPPQRTRAPAKSERLVKYYPQNDAGRAARFVDQFGRDIRFVPTRNCWLIWQGNRWRVDRDGAIERRAVQLSCDMLRDAARIHGADKAQEEVRRQACGRRFYTVIATILPITYTFRASTVG
jgi:hypothetical protein